MTVIYAASPTDAASDDATFIRAVRENVEDVPKPALEQISGAGGTSTWYQCSQVPINDDDFLSISVGGVAQQVVTTRANVSANQVFVDFDTGLLVFGTAPPQGTNNIQVVKNRVRWRDTQILRALVSGLRVMFPKFGRTYVDTSIQLTTNKWDYTLPLIFNDDRVKITAVGVQEVPSATQPFRPFRGWTRVGLTTLHIPGIQGFAPGSTLRIEYYGPYQSLSGLDPRASGLPILYATGYLLGNREIRRTRTDTQNVAAGEQANPPGVAQNAGSYFMKQFWAELSQMARPVRMGGVITTYQKG